MSQKVTQRRNAAAFCGLEKYRDIHVRQKCLNATFGVKCICFWPQPMEILPLSMFTPLWAQSLGILLPVHLVTCACEATIGKTPTQMGREMTTPPHAAAAPKDESR